ncbi:sensor histidine kinase [Streptomyces sp. RLB3-17]|uniref:sensor histidine kinase n=1 Tax=unclassified Streptomyces TaxID=2593676 RepID=UPI0011641162|nr:MULTISPECIES: ATP-binding protein [unclassified Streptomyces]QDN99118.1 sensor histidine kinase [Streptomyces sp. RLB1-9]QDO20832.1 sensor histidine kinase [Streptomyces sp. S1A1-8]QDO30958.1 sensor histidine kinase [Streptomyces sp. S1A1-3]QDO40875.1 sensor histidine kinase [Streptomyces sp. RLB3-17]
MTAPIPSGERPTLRASAPAPLLTAVAAAVAVVVAVSLAPDSARVPLAWGTGAAAVLLCVAVAVAARALQTAKLARRRLDTVAQDAGRLLQERARMAEEFNRERSRLAEESARDRARLADADARERALLTKGFEEERQRLTIEITEERRRFAELAEENTRLTERLRRAGSDRAAAISATANAAGRMQALSTGMLADLRAMEEKHSDEEVLADLLHLDHRTAQAGRLADSVAVLAGARSGRRWARPIVMESILRGAMGRIGGYQRVRVHSASDAAVAGHAAEGVMHALAELLDNAANFSPPTAEVHVYVEEVPAGVIVSVEDSGLVMGDVQLRRAERAVSADAENAAGLGGLTGTRLGLAVVGRLARKHGLKVSFRPSARGGTGVLVLIPQDILSLPSAPVPAAPAATEPQAKPAAAPPSDEERPLAEPRPQASYAAARAPEDLDPDPVPTHESPRHATATDTPPNGTPTTGTPATGGLPKRRRGRTLAHAERSRAHLTNQAGPEPRTTDSKATAARFSSFRQAVRGTAPDQAAVQGTVPEDEAVRATAYTAEDAVRDELAQGEPVRVESAQDESGNAVRGEEAVREPAPAHPSHTSSHPEGDTTS